MNKIVSLTLTLLALLPLCSCEEDESPVVSSIVNKEELSSVKHAGDLVQIRLWASAIEGELSQLTLCSFDGQYGEVVLLDTLLSGREAELSVSYQIPSFQADSVSHTLQLSVRNTRGARSYHEFSMMVVGGSQTLVEKSGLLLYAGNSGRPDALQLVDPSQTYLRASADTSRHADIYCYAEADDESGVLSRIWKSETQTDFVKYNQFDYAQATSLSVTNAYQMSVHQNFVSDVKAGDIIIVGKDRCAWGVILVTMVLDNEGTSDDGYLLNYKRLR